MERIFVPFTIANTKDAPAEAKVNFTIQRRQSQFKAAVVTRLKFMKLYEQSKYEMLQHPFTQTWDQWKAYLDINRELISNGSATRNDLNFGHARSPELRALDELPHLIEIEMTSPGIGVDRTSVNANAQLEYQTIDVSKKKFIDKPKTIQTHLVYLSGLVRAEYGGWEGTITCNMSDVGFFRMENQALSNQFELKIRMYNFKREQLSTIPAMELNILFR